MCTPAYHVSYRDPYLGAPLFNELLCRQLRLSELLRLLPGLALLVGDNLKTAKSQNVAFISMFVGKIINWLAIFCQKGQNSGHFLAFASVFVARKSQTSGRFLALANVFVASVLVSALFQLQQQCTS